MLKANEAKAMVKELIDKAKAEVKEQAIEYCETTINEAIKKSINNKSNIAFVKCNEELKAEAVNYLKEQGYEVHSNGFGGGLDIRW